MKHRYNINTKIFIFLIFIGIIIALYYSRDLLIRQLKEFVNISLTQQKPQADDDIEQINDEQLPSFIEPATQHKQKDENHYLSQSTLKNDQSEKDSSDFPIFENYYLFMKNLNSLIANFLQEKSCTEQLERLSVVNLPISIQEIVNDIARYNTQYLDRIQNDGQIGIKGKLKFLNKFIKINKQPDKDGRSNLKMSVLSNIEQLLNYFCSKEFRNQFVNQVQQ